MRRALQLALALTLPLASQASAQVKLVEKYPEGSRRYGSTIHTHQILTIAGTDTVTDANVESTAVQTVDPAAADGTRKVHQKTEGLTIHLALPGGANVAFDSAKPDAKAENPAFETILDAYRVLAKTHRIYVLDKDGHLVSIEDPQNLLTTLPQALRDEIREEIDPESLKKYWQQEAGKFPDNPVEKGARWKRMETMPLGAGQILQLETFYEYQGGTEKDGKTIDKIGIFISSVKFDIDAKSTLPIRAVRSDLKVESCTGTARVDRDTGLVLESGTSLRIKGTLTLSINGMELPATLDLTLDTNTALRP